MPCQGSDIGQGQQETRKESVGDSRPGSASPESARIIRRLAPVPEGYPGTGACLVSQRPFQFGLRFSANALGPSTVSSLRAMATKEG